MSTLIAYFSAGGTTRRVARAASRMLSADLFEIKPAKPYSRGDINWMNPLSRCNREKAGRRDVPVKDRVESFESYDTVILGFPIWYGVAPNVVNTFCKGYDWRGKKVYVFATSGGSGMGKTKEKLTPYVIGSEIKSDRLITSESDLRSWFEECGLLQA